MRRARLGLCIGDREYGDRFTSCLMNHYRDQLELHMFSQKEALQENWKTLDAIVLSDDLAGENRIECEIPQIYNFPIYVFSIHRIQLNTALAYW